ncbi:MAG: hypothetical protein HOB05_00425 [Bacteroidetes bacterium]|jgi:hypothetical protein|nr:hypothetical protein [Bacteroidota bacterium]MBT6684768.1 hypothetical protein [Bacteroidota bacterium]MBT7144286.1 hypothetical protein [Bacteroidota bacterium]
MKMKLFGKANTKKDGSCMTDLENEINDWLKNNPNIEILDIKQSASGGSFHDTKLFVTVWYEEGE